MFWSVFPGFSMHFNVYFHKARCAIKNRGSCVQYKNETKTWAEKPRRGQRQRHKGPKLTSGRTVSGTLAGGGGGAQRESRGLVLYWTPSFCARTGSALLLFIWCFRAPGTLRSPHGNHITIIKRYFTIKEAWTPKVKKLSRRVEGGFRS